MSQTASDLVDRYFETRDNFIRDFESSSSSADDRRALSELEKQIKAIVGPVNVEGFPQPGTINLQTLHKELGFGQVDGLAFVGENDQLFVTTDTLLKRYLADSPQLPGDFSELSRSGSFYLRAFSQDAAVTYYADVPVDATTGDAYARAFLGVIAQDIGPFVPKVIFVFVSTGGRILAVRSQALAEITDIPLCRSEWEEFDQKRSDAFDTYRASGLNDKQAIADSHRYDEQGFEAYHRCYDREAKNQTFFAPLTQQAQSIVERLQRSQASR